MKKYQVKKYFEWGSLKLEPLQYLEVKPDHNEDSLVVTRESTQESIFVTKKAFQIQVELGTITAV